MYNPMYQLIFSESLLLPFKFTQSAPLSSLDTFLHPSTVDENPTLFLSLEVMKCFVRFSLILLEFIQT